MIYRQKNKQTLSDDGEIIPMCQSSYGDNTKRLGECLEIYNYFNAYALIIELEKIWEHMYVHDFYATFETKN